LFQSHTGSIQRPVFYSFRTNRIKVLALLSDSYGPFCVVGY